jgi:hypothetical protein
MKPGAVDGCHVSTVHDDQITVRMVEDVVMIGDACPPVTRSISPVALWYRGMFAPSDRSKPPSDRTIRCAWLTDVSAEIHE